MRLGRPGNACESQTARNALSLECQPFRASSSLFFCQGFSSSSLGAHKKCQPEQKHEKASIKECCTNSTKSAHKKKNLLPACCMPPQNSHRGLSASDSVVTNGTMNVHFSSNGTIPQNPSKSMEVLIKSI